MPINNEGGNKTLARTIDLDALKSRDVPRYLGTNLLVNPFFEHVGTQHVNGLGLHTNFSNTFEYAPGWYNFGYDSYGAIGEPPSPAQNPFYSPGNRAGVSIHQNDGKVYGICQRVHRANLLAGQRVRLSGVYQKFAGTAAVTGISVFLVSHVKSVDVDPDKADGDANESYWHKATAGNWDSVVLKSGPATSPLLGHVIRMTKQGNGYSEGEEYFNRAFDWWDKTGPLGDRIPIIYFGSENAGAVDAGGLGTSGEKQNSTIYYLSGLYDGAQAEGTSYDGTDGYFEVFSEAVAAPGVTLQRFETYVDIPAAMADTGVSGVYGDMWIVVMPVHPTDIGSMAGVMSVIQLFALSLEPVARDAEGQLMYGAMNPGAFGAAMGVGLGGLPQRHLLQYPIYVPALYSLDVNGLLPAGENGGVTYDPFFQYSQRLFTDYAKYQYGDGAGGEVPMLQRQADLPPGSGVLKASFSVQAAGNMTISAVELRQLLGYVPRSYAVALDAGTTYPGGSGSEAVITWTSTPYSPVSSEVKTANASRNRVGFHWALETADGLHKFDGSGDATGSLEDVSVQGSASSWLSMKLAGGSTTNDHVILHSGWLLVAVDPRWHHAQWKRTP